MRLADLKSALLRLAFVKFALDSSAFSISTSWRLARINLQALDAISLQDVRSRRSCSFYVASVMSQKSRSALSRQQSSKQAPFKSAPAMP